MEGGGGNDDYAAVLACLAVEYRERQTDFRVDGHHGVGLTKELAAKRHP